MSRTALVLALMLALTLSACQLPNPYKPPPPQQPQPAPGGAPTLPTPAPPPTEQPAPPPEPVEEPPVPPPVREYQLGSAAQSLVSQARTQAAAGNFAVAASSIERALRIEPNNPLLWIELGRVRQAEGNYAQAENMGRKGLSLATGDPRTQSSAWRLIAEALRARGRAPQAQEAEARADALTPR
ncbi:MAG TPA: tetratricopeptide repeat protein [Steroidobacteraceae bacterium]|nr:tetratricopeptide repeat protein [Steroidobacteraceae bacterium]